jgi:GAF domain-containing protein/HAMP domain-containing protein
MSIRARLIVVTILVGLVPALIAFLVVTVQMQRLVDASQQAVARIAAVDYEELTRSVQGMAETIAGATRFTRLSFMLLAVGIVIAAVMVAVATAMSITDPLREMAVAANRAREGKLDAIPPYHRFDAVGTLSLALYDMAKRMQQLMQDAELGESAWTAELARRMHYLETTSEIASAMTGVVDLPGLFAQTVTSISHRFGHYHVGVFLLNPTGEWAVLQAASSEAGQRMLSQEYRVRVGQEDNAVGYATARGISQMVLSHRGAPSARELSWMSPWTQRGVDTEGMVAPVNPDMPKTHTELALPMKVRGEIVGALDIQSTEEHAFSDEDANVLQALADQLAVAISNARLFQQVQESLEAERKAYGEVSREAWKEMLLTRPSLGFARDKRGLIPIGDVRSEGAQTASGEGANSLETPIKVRGHVIGVIDTHKPDGTGSWTPEEIAVLEVLADQLGTALEGARLYQDAQRRAARERLTRDITDKMRRAASIEGVVQAAVDELFGALGTSRAFVRLGIGLDGDDNGEGPARGVRKT